MLYIDYIQNIQVISLNIPPFNTVSEALLILKEGAKWMLLDETVEGFC